MSINPKDNEQNPGLIGTGEALAQLFIDCGFPLTPETRQIYLPFPTPVAPAK